MNERQRATGEKCPHCGAAIYVVQENATGDALQPRWVQASGHQCPRNCQLALRDFPQGCKHDG